MRLSLNKNHVSETAKEPKKKLLTKKHKRGWAIFAGIVVVFVAIGYVSGVMEQSRFEKDNVPIVISDTEDNIKLDYRTSEREISAKISGISVFADIKSRWRWR